MTRTPSDAVRDIQRAAERQTPEPSGVVVHLVHEYVIVPDHPEVPQCVWTRVFATAALAHAYAEEITGAVIETVPVEGASGFDTDELELIATAMGNLAGLIEGLGDGRGVKALQRVRIKAQSMAFQQVTRDV